jgi:hypothetical protein
MVVIAIVILLSILIIANLSLVAVNHFYPPCDNSDYFTNAQKVSSDAVKSLKSLKTVVKDSRVNSLSRVGNVRDSFTQQTEFSHGAADTKQKLPKLGKDQTHYLSTPTNDDMDLDDLEIVASNAVIKPSKLNKTTYDSISAMFPTSSQKTSTHKKSNNEIAGYVADFNDEMDGIHNRNHLKNKSSIHNPSQFVHRNTERDGYERSTDLSI